MELHRPASTGGGQLHGKAHTVMTGATCEARMVGIAVEIAEAISSHPLKGEVDRPECTLIEN